MVDGVGAAGERIGRNTEMLLVPEMHPRLVAHLDPGVDVREQRRGLLDDPVLGLVAQAHRISENDVEQSLLGCGREVTQASSPVMDLGTARPDATGTSTPTRQRSR